MSAVQKAKTPARASNSPRLAVRIAASLAAGILTVFSTSCTRTQVVNYEQYERIPNTPASATFRVLAKSTPLTREKAFYGNYGGPGNAGGAPRDEMDELFRRHDIVYYMARTQENMLTADEELVARLNAIDAERLGSQAIEFRNRAIDFFESPVSHVIGKPWSCFVASKERADSYFHSPAMVREFFSEDHPGMPEVDGPRSEGRNRWEVASRQ